MLDKLISHEAKNGNFPFSVAVRRGKGGEYIEPKVTMEPYRMKAANARHLINLRNLINHSIHANTRRCALCNSHLERFTAFTVPTGAVCPSKRDHIHVSVFRLSQLCSETSNKARPKANDTEPNRPKPSRQSGMEKPEKERKTAHREHQHV